MAFLQQRSRSSSSLSISSSDEEELNERSGLQQKKRGDLAKKVHEIRDVKGQVLKWAQADEELQGRSGKKAAESSRPAGGTARAERTTNVFAEEHQ
jgi:hypothetical protein